MPIVTPSDVNTQITTILRGSDLASTNRNIPFNDPIVVQGTCDKKHFLADYQDKFGKNNTDLIVTQKR